MAIETLYRAGDDALQNQFAITFSEIPFMPELDFLTARVTSVDVPAQSVGTYEVHYGTQSFTKPSGKIDTTNEFSFEFRVDKYWTLYKGLKLWLNYIGSNADGSMAEDVGAIGGESGIRIPFITVRTEDSMGIQTSTGWTFEKCFIQNLDGTSFSQDSGDPITVSVTLHFLKMTSFED